MPERVLVVGNGESRLCIDLKKFKKNYTIVGCNALYRDIEVPYLICCDLGMAREASEHLKNSATKIYTRDRWLGRFDNINRLPDLPYTGDLRIDKPENWGSGVYAILLACQLNSEEITLIGFDLYGIDHKFNNVYKGSSNYKNINDKSLDPDLWIYQISKIFDSYNKTQFIIVNKPSWKIPIEWKKSNVVFKNIEEYFVDL